MHMPMQTSRQTGFDAKDSAATVIAVTGKPYLTRDIGHGHNDIWANGHRTQDTHMHTYMDTRTNIMDTYMDTNMDTRTKWTH
eukprot:629650-Amorphochlora_amoeboformis.AAC.1